MDTPEIVISSMIPEEIDQVYELGLATKELQISQYIDMFYPKEYLLRALDNPNYICLVAKVNGEFAGFRLAQIDPELGETYLSDIVVKPQFQGLGVGRQLFETGIQILKAKGTEWTWALVHEDNQKMQQFLEKQGFTKGRKFYFYYKSED